VIRVALLLMLVLCGCSSDDSLPDLEVCSPLPFKKQEIRILDKDVMIVDTIKIWSEWATVPPCTTVVFIAWDDEMGKTINYARLSDPVMVSTCQTYYITSQGDTIKEIFNYADCD